MYWGDASSKLSLAFRGLSSEKQTYGIKTYSGQWFFVPKRSVCHALLTIPVTWPPCTNWAAQKPNTGTRAVPVSLSTAGDAIRLSQNSSLEAKLLTKPTTKLLFSSFYFTRRYQSSLKGGFLTVVQICLYCPRPLKQQQTSLAMNKQETEIYEYEEIFLSTKWAAFVED